MLEFLLRTSGLVSKMLPNIGIVLYTFYILNTLCYMLNAL